MLGLVHVPEAVGLDGHSDADVATHALCDALLGAAGLGDLGRHFPDSDPAFKGAASRRLLEATVTLVRGAGFVVVNADITIVAERPRLALFMPAMEAALRDVVGGHVSVKATTTEGLGTIGRGEGIAASAVVLVEER
jgi:2-C-methyl-D-erythritol 2,4-cyclodiphosphate synthase